MTLPWYIKAVLTAVTLPFLIGGILLAAVVAKLLPAGAWLILIGPLFVVGILLGGIVAYALVVFATACGNPNSQYLAETEQSESRIVNFLWPAFRLVKTVSLRLAILCRGGA